MLNQIFQVTVVVGSAVGLWSHNWALLLVCAVAVVVVYASQTSGSSYPRCGEKCHCDGEDSGELYYEESNSEPYADVHEEPYEGEGEDVHEEAYANAHDTVALKTEPTNVQLNRTNSKPKLYDESSYSYIRPFLGKEMAQRNMNSPSRYIEPPVAREKLMRQIAMDQRPRAAKDKYYIPSSSNCGTRTRPAF